MKYTGRIMGLALVLIFSSIDVISYYIDCGEARYFKMIGDVISLVVGWWCGKQYDKVKFLAEKDVLTGIYNRRYVLENLDKLLALMKRNNQKLSIFMIDIDDFKSINDTYGHQMGDHVLQHVSNILLRNVSKNGVVARWGGDEFLIIAPKTNELESKNMLQLIEKELRKDSEKLEITITASVGAATYPNDAENLDCLIKAADKNMYERKKDKK